MWRRGREEEREKKSGRLAHYEMRLICRVPNTHGKSRNTHGKRHTANNGWQRGCLPCVACRAHGVAFAVCRHWLTAKFLE